MIDSGREGKKHRQEERTRLEDQALHRAFLWFAGAVVLRILFFLVENYYVNFDITEEGIALADFIGRFMGLARYIATALGICGVVWTAIRSAKGKAKIWLGAVSVFLLALGVSCALIYANSGTVGFLKYLLLAAVVLALVYYLYQREFFLVALLGASAILGVWLVLQEGERNIRSIAITAGLVAVYCCVALVLRLLQSRDGRLKVGRHETAVLSEGTGYGLLYLTCAVMCLALVLALAAGALVIATVFYAVPVAWLLVMAVYYTIKLM